MNKENKIREVKNKIMRLCDKHWLKYPEWNYKSVKETSDKINKLEDQNFNCPYCWKFLWSSSIICSCEVTNKFDEDYDNWINK